MDSANKAMTAAEKARRMEDMAEHPYSHNMSNSDSEIAAEAAAYFRALVPDANGLLPCPMCGPGTRIVVLEQKYKGMLWRRIQCRECALYTPMRRTEIEARRAWNRRGGVTYD